MTYFVAFGLFRGLFDGLFRSFLLLTIFLIFGHELQDQTNDELSFESQRLDSHHLLFTLLLHKVVFRRNEVQQGLEGGVVFLQRCLQIYKGRRHRMCSFSAYLMDVPGDPQSVSARLSTPTLRKRGEFSSV